jgi:hypothetical protein
VQPEQPLVPFPASPRLHHTRRERVAERRGSGLPVERIHETVEHDHRRGETGTDVGRLRRRQPQTHRRERLAAVLDMRRQVMHLLERDVLELIPLRGRPDRRATDATDRSPAVAEAQEVERKRLAVHRNLDRHPRTLIGRFRVVTEAQVLERFPPGRMPVGTRRRHRDRGLPAVAVAERDRELGGDTEARAEPRGHADGARKPV